MRYFFLFFALLPSLVLGDGVLQARDAWLRAMPPGQPNSAIYLTLHNTGPTPVAVVGARSALAPRVEFHSSEQVDGMWRMQALERLEIRPGGSLALSPGGVHLMLFGVSKSPREGEVVELTLQLDDGSELEISAQVRGLADANPHQHH